MAVIDTSFLIAAWNEDDEHHARARRMLRKGGPLRVNAGALAEASRIIRRSAKLAGVDGNVAARDFLATFMRLPEAILETSHAHDAWRRYLDSPRFSLVDAWVVEQAKALGEPAWSFDSAIQAALE